MLYGLVILIHVLVAFFLIAVILLQGGRGSLGETMGGTAAQSLFGGGANIVMTKITAVCAALFMVTCLSLAILSTHRGRSVIDQLPATPEQLPILPHPAHPSSAEPIPPSSSIPAPSTTGSHSVTETTPRGQSGQTPASNETTTPASTSTTGSQ